MNPLNASQSTLFGLAWRRYDDVGGIAGATFEIAAAEMALCFHMSDHGLDGGAPRELAFDAAEDPAFLA